MTRVNFDSKKRPEKIAMQTKARRAKMKAAFLTGLGSVINISGEPPDFFEERVTRRKKRLNPKHVVACVERVRSNEIKKAKHSVLGDLNFIDVRCKRKATKRLETSGQANTGLYGDQLAVGSDLSLAFHKAATRAIVEKAKG